MNAADFFRRSDAKIRDGDWDSGLVDLNQAIALDPNNLEYLWSRANLYYEQDNYEQAVEDFTRIMELSSDLDELFSAHIRRAISYEHLGRYEALIGDLDWIISHGYDKGDYTEWRGLHKRELGDLLGALADFTKALQHSPQSDRFLLQRGRTYYQLRQFENAIEDFTNLLNLSNIDSPMLQAAYRWRGSTFYRLGSYQNALHDFNEVMKLYKLDTLTEVSEYVSLFGLPSCEDIP